MIQWLHAGRLLSSHLFYFPAAPWSIPWDYLTWLIIMEPYGDMLCWKQQQTRLQAFIWFVLTHHIKKEKLKGRLWICFCSSAKIPKSPKASLLSLPVRVVSVTTLVTHSSLFHKKLSQGVSKVCDKIFFWTETKHNLAFTFEYAETEELFMMDVEGKTVIGKI